MHPHFARINVILPIERRGELAVSGYLLMKEYWADPEKTAEVMILDPLINGIISRCHSRDGTCFRHSITNSQFGQIQYHVEAKIVNPVDKNVILPIERRGELAVSGYLLMKLTANSPRLSMGRITFLSTGFTIFASTCGMSFPTDEGILGRSRKDSGSDDSG
jgi:acyl-CoA synthetase (AMP-forming)/AMP-acid ligase II